MRSPHTISKMLLRVVWIGFLGVLGFGGLLCLIAVLAGVWFAGVAMLLILLLPVTVLLSLGGIVLAVWSAFREKVPRAWLTVAGFLPPCIISTLVFAWILFAGSHF